MSVVNEALLAVDPSGETVAWFDEEVERWAIARLSPLPGDKPTILLHVCEDSGYRGSWIDALQDEEVQEKIGTGEWAGCPRCGQVHGAYRDVGIADVDTLMAEFPHYWPYGIDDFLWRQELVRLAAMQQAQYEKDERWGEHIEEAVWAMVKSKSLLSNSASTKEERAEIARARERKTERRLREMDW